MFPNKHDLPALTESESEKYMTCAEAAETIHPIYGRWFFSLVEGGVIETFMLRGARCVRKEAFKDWCKQVQYVLDNPDPQMRGFLDQLELAKAELAKREQASSNAGPNVPNIKRQCPPEPPKPAKPEDGASAAQPMIISRSSGSRPRIVPIYKE